MGGRGIVDPFEAYMLANTKIKKMWDQNKRGGGIFRCATFQNGF